MTVASTTALVLGLTLATLPDRIRHGVSPENLASVQRMSYLQGVWYEPIQFDSHDLDHISLRDVW